MARAKRRCKWATGGSDAYTDYHDNEWGVPVHEDWALFELLILEGAQAGLSWSTILNKREGYRKAFASFDARKVARFDNQRIERLLKNPDIVRNRLKVESTVSNAKAFLALQREHGSFDDYLWRFVDGKAIQNRHKAFEEIPATTAISDRLSKDLKRRGFRFVGSTICYAFMQAVGMVNDHEIGCFRYREIKGLST